MKICVVGGIFDKPPDYRRTVLATPETTLIDGLRARGHDVEGRGHHAVGELGRFDVVHVHHLARGAVVAALSPGPARLVFTNHGMNHNSPAHYAGFRFVVSRSDAVVALSESEARWQQARADVTGRQYVIPNGIRSDIFRYSPPRASGGAWRLLYVGQLTGLKGIDYLFDALHEFQDACDVELRLVYHIDAELHRLRSRARELGLERVWFLGARTPAELAELYAATDVLVLPSTTEALPSVISEAMMVGRPVVATDVGGVRAQVGSFGVVVPPRDGHALAQALLHVISNYDCFARSSESASRCVSRRFSLTQVIVEHEKMYEHSCRGSVRRIRLRYRVGSRLARRVLDLGRKWNGHHR